MPSNTNTVKPIGVNKIVEAKRSTAYTIEDINLLKPENSRVRAVRFASKYYTPKGVQYTRIVCQCFCGNYFTTLLSSVTQGKTISCGCYHKEVVSRKGFSISDLNSRKPSGSRLTAISLDFIHTTSGGQKIKIINALCSCGKTTTVRQPDMMSGHTKSCGCYEEEVLMKRNTKYSHNIPKINQCWHSMMKRCYDPKTRFYNIYGGRGVRVCKKWHNYQNFLDWAIDKWKPGLQLDKDIKGSGKLYSPSNCLFVTGRENSNNTSRNVKYDYKGEQRTLTEIARAENILPSVLRVRIVVIKMPLADAIAYGNKKLNKWETKKYRS